MITYLSIFFDTKKRTMSSSLGCIINAVIYFLLLIKRSNLFLDNILDIYYRSSISFFLLFFLRDPFHFLIYITIPMIITTDIINKPR